MEILYIGRSAKKLSDPMHSHTAWEIICSVDGNGTVCLSDCEVRFDERTVICVPPGFKHTKEAHDGFEDFWLWCTDFPLNDDKITLLQDNSERSILNTIGVMYSVYHSTLPEKDVIVTSMLEAFKSLIRSQVCGRRLSTEVENIRSAIVKGFKDSDFSLKQCLSSQGYCVDYLRKRFVAEIGETPHEYLNNLRMNTAKKLLAARRESGNTIDDIAELVGFCDVGYFCRAFKARFGVSPGKYNN